MIDVLFLERLQRDPRFLQDLVLPRQQLGAKVIALAVVHERLFFGGSIVLQLFQGQPICSARRTEKGRSARALYSGVMSQTISTRASKLCTALGFRSGTCGHNECFEPPSRPPPLLTPPT